MNQYQPYSKNKDEDKKINLIDIIYYILLHWRSILIVAFVLCALCSGFKLMKGFDSLGSQNLSETQKTYERSHEEYMTMKRQLEDQVDGLTQAIQAKDIYHKQSILMNLNPDAVYKSTLTYAVNDIADVSLLTSDIESAQLVNRRINSVLGAYASLIQGGEILQNVKNVIGADIDQKYLAELVYVQVDYQSKLLHITILAEDKNQVETISDAIVKGLQDANFRMSAMVGEHRLQLLSSYIGNDVDTSILIGSIPEDGMMENGNYQTSVECLQKNDTDVVLDLQNQLIDCNDKLSKLKEPAKPSGTSRAMILKSGIKFGILGFIVGAFLMAYYYVLQYLVCGKLMSPEEMQDDYEVSVLADYKAPLSRHTNSIDKLINRMCGISEKRSCLGEVYTLAATNVLARMGMAANEKILLVGNASAKVFDTSASEMVDKLNFAGIEVIAAGNINENGDAILKLQNAEKIVLIEQAGVSRRKDIKKELQTLQDLKKEILGAVVL